MRFTSGREGFVTRKAGRALAIRKTPAGKHKLVDVRGENVAERGGGESVNAFFGESQSERFQSQGNSVRWGCKRGGKAGGVLSCLLSQKKKGGRDYHRASKPRFNAHTHYMLGGGKQ